MNFPMKLTIHVLFERFSTNNQLNAKQFQSLISDTNQRRLKLMHAPTIADVQKIIHSLSSNNNNTLSSIEFTSWVSKGLEISTKQRAKFAKKGETQKCLVNFVQSIQDDIHGFIKKVTSSIHRYSTTTTTTLDTSTFTEWVNSVSRDYDDVVVLRLTKVSSTDTASFFADEVSTYCTRTNIDIDDVMHLLWRALTDRELSKKPLKYISFWKLLRRKGYRLMDAELNQLQVKEAEERIREEKKQPAIAAAVPVPSINQATTQITLLPLPLLPPPPNSPKRKATSSLIRNDTNNKRKKKNNVHDFLSHTNVTLYEPPPPPPSTMTDIDFSKRVLPVVDFSLAKQITIEQMYSQTSSSRSQACKKETTQNKELLLSTALVPLVLPTVVVPSAPMFSPSRKRIREYKVDNVVTDGTNTNTQETTIRFESPKRARTNNKHLENDLENSSPRRQSVSIRTDHELEDELNSCKKELLALKQMVLKEIIRTKKRN